MFNFKISFHLNLDSLPQLSEATRKILTREKIGSMDDQIQMKHMQYMLGYTVQMGVIKTFG